MLQAFIIVLREVLEAALIIGIVMAASRGVPQRGQWVLAGVGAGLLGSIVVAGFAEAIASGAIALDRAAGLADAVAALCELPGIGPWTAHYIAMRACAERDAFPASDLAIRRALGPDPEAEAERWRPWSVPHVLLGDQSAGCALSRARSCPVPGHPCLDGVPVERAVEA